MLNILNNTGKFSALCKCNCGNTFTVNNRYDAKKSFIGHLCDLCKYYITKQEELSQSFIKKAFKYNPETGNLTYRFTQAAGKTGEIATINHSGGYLSVRINGKDYLTHRIIWLYMKGYLPLQIDHINHVRDDNRWINLREVSNRENHLNESIPNNSTTNVLGVSLIKATNRFRAYIVIHNKQIHLGVFNTLNEARIARCEANIKYSFHENHGSVNA